MNRKTLVSSIVTIVLCLSLIAGTTYALFTSEDNVNIAVNSGKVSVTATVTELVTYSMGEATANNGTFANGGTAVFAPVEGVKTLSLTNVTPGDKVTFTIELTNASTIDIQYRLIWNISGALSEALEINASNLDWTQWATSEEATKKIDVTVELPADFETQGLEDAAITFTVEAVQGNAIVKDVATADQLWTALEMGAQNITLTQDITLDSDQVITVAEGATATISLNGNELIGTAHKSVGAVIKNNGTLTITGGTISSTAANGGSAIVNNGTLTVNNATLNGASNADGSWPSYTVNNTGVMTVNDATITSVHGAVCSYGAGAVLTLNNTNIEMSGIPGFTSHGIYTYDDGQAIVNGGNIANNATDQNATGASVINGNVIVNSGNFTGRIEAYYGTPVISGGTFSEQPKASYLAQYHAAYQNTDGTWTVDYAETVAAPSTNEDLQAAISGGKETVLVQAGTYTFPSGVNSDSVTIICEEGTVFEGNTKLNIGGATVVGATFSNPSGTAVDQTINGTFKNCTFTGSNGLRWCYAGETVVFENCVFDGSVYGVHFDGGANDVTFKDCTFSGFNALGGAIEKATLEGCTFKANGKSGYNGINLWGNTEMKNCTFVFDGSTTEWVDAMGSNMTYTFTDCVVVDGEGNEKNFAEYVGNYGEGNTIVIDGVTQIYGSTEAEIADNMSDYLAGEEKVEIVMKEDLAFSAGDTTSNSGYGATGLTVNNGSTLDGNGNTLTVNNANGTWDCAVNPKSGTIKNLTINGSFRGIFMGSAEGDVYIDNVIIDKVCYTFNSDGGSKEYGVYISNSTLNGWTSYSDVHKEVIFTNCQFGKGTGGYQYAFCRPYNYTEFIGCNFEEGFVVDPIGAVIFENCTLNGVAITAENVDLLVTSTDNVTVK